MDKPTRCAHEAKAERFDLLSRPAILARRGFVHVPLLAASLGLGRFKLQAGVAFCLLQRCQVCNQVGELIGFNGFE